MDVLDNYSGVQSLHDAYLGSRTKYLSTDGALGLYARYAPAAATGTTDAVGLTAMNDGCYLIDPANASGIVVHLTSAGTSGQWVKIINIATAATGLVAFATSDQAGGAFLASASGYFNFTVRANAAVDLLCLSATRWIVVGTTAGLAAFAAAT